jgi:hypothetical protein
MIAHPFDHLVVQIFDAHFCRLVPVSIKVQERQLLDPGRSLWNGILKPADVKDKAVALYAKAANKIIFDRRLRDIDAKSDRNRLVNMVPKLRTR